MQRPQNWIWLTMKQPPASWEPFQKIPQTESKQPPADSSQTTKLAHIVNSLFCACTATHTKEKAACTICTVFKDDKRKRLQDKDAAASIQMSARLWYTSNYRKRLTPIDRTVNRSEAAGGTSLALQQFGVQIAVMVTGFSLPIFVQNRGQLKEIYK